VSIIVISILKAYLQAILDSILVVCAHTVCQVSRLDKFREQKCTKVGHGAILSRLDGFLASNPIRRIPSEHMSTLRLLYQFNDGMKGNFWLTPS